MGRLRDIFRSQCAAQGVLVSQARGFAPNVREAPEAVRVCLSYEADEARLTKGLHTVGDLRGLPPSGAELQL